MRGLATLGQRRLGLGGGGGAATTVILPQLFLPTPGTIIENFENTANWNQDSGTRVANTTAGQFRTETQSIKVTSLAGGNGTISKTVNWLFPSTGARLRLYFYMHTACTDYGSFYFDLSTTTNWSKYFSVATTLNNNHIGWNVVDLYPSQWTNTGGAVWTDPIVRAQIRHRGGVGITAELSYDSLEGNLVGRPLVMATFDDGLSSVYTQAYSYMRDHGARATAYAITGAIGQAGRATQAQLLEMDAAGWSIGNHTRAHTDLSQGTQSDMETAIANGITDLEGMGLTRASHHLAYPGGTWNETTLAAMAAQSMLTARTVSIGYPSSTPHGDQDYQIPMYQIMASTTLAVAKGFVDASVSGNKILCLMLHDIVAVPGGVNWGISDFRALIDYIVSLRIPFVTINDFYDSQTGPVIVPAMK